MRITYPSLNASPARKSGYVCRSMQSCRDCVRGRSGVVLIIDTFSSFGLARDSVLVTIVFHLHPIRVRERSIRSGSGRSHASRPSY